VRQKKITSDDEKKIVDLYTNGFGSTYISKTLKIPKHSILFFLKKENLIRDRTSNKSKYKEFWFENGRWYGYRLCPKCDDKVLCYAQKEYLLFRNINNKTKKGCLCKKCYSEVYSGGGNNFYGRKHSEESKKNISKNREGKYKGDNHHTKKEQYKKLSKIIMENNWQKGLLDKDKMSELMKLNIRLGKLKTQNKSKKEGEIKNFLNSMGYEVIQYFRVDTKICDFYLPKINLIIEYFGDYWHCNPIKYDENYFNHKKGLKAKELWDQDNNRLELIKNFGYNLEVIWETELKYNNNKLLKIIKKYDKRD
jgi:very-short-patch-repair endonuclease